MFKFHQYLVLGLIASLFLTGCASTGLSDTEKTLAYEEFIKTEKLERTGSINAFKLNGWRYLNRDYLVLFSSFRRPYLVEIAGMCYELDFSHTIGIHRSGTRLSEKFDSIFVPGHPHQKCFIKSIHKLTREQADQLSDIGREKKAEDKPAQETTQSPDDNEATSD